MDHLTHFTSSYDVRNHYMMKMKKSSRVKYMQLLSLAIRKQLDNDYTAQRLKKLGELLLDGEDIPKVDNSVEKLSKSVVKHRLKSGKRIKFSLLCAAL